MKKTVKLLFVFFAAFVVTALAAASASAASCGPDAPWSAWSDTKPTQTANMAVEEATFYSYRTKSTTSSSSSSLDGWTRYDYAVTGYGSKQGPVTYDPSGNDRKVTSERYVTSSNYKTVYKYYHWWDGSSHYTVAWSQWGSYQYKQTVETDNPLELRGYSSDGTPEYKYYYNGTNYWVVYPEGTRQVWVSDNYATRYYYQEPIYTYYFYKWSEWSAYSQTEQTATSTKQVSQKTMYRYRYTAHDLGAETVMTQPTCTKTGLSARACKNCGDIITKTIPKKGHTYKSKITRQPTCVEPGVRTYTCSVCKKTVKKEIKTVDHTYKRVVVKATTARNGSIKSKCAVCGKVASSKTIRRIQTLKLSKTAFLVNGKVRKPTVIIRNTNGKDIAAKYYTVTYSNAKSKAIGTYTVTVKFKGIYGGTKVLTYKITRPAQVSGIEQIYEKGIYFRWDKVSGAQGYEVFISPANANEFKKVATQTNNRLKNSNLKASIKVKIRAYVVIDGKKVYGSFSKTVTMKPFK